MNSSWPRQCPGLTASQRREMWRREVKRKLALPRHPYCQACWLPITDGHSRFLHERCADWLHNDVYRTPVQRHALELYDLEQEVIAADDPSATPQISSPPPVSGAQANDAPATGSAPAAGVGSTTTEREYEK